MRLPISQTIKRLRKEKNITQQTLADELHVTFQSVSRWENDIAYPDVELIPMIASYFGVSTDVLFGTDETTVEYKRQQYLNAVKEMEKTHTFEKFKELERFLKNVIKEFPHDVYFQWKLCSLYWRNGFECAKKNLETMRKLASFVIENDKSIDGNYRIACIRVMIRVEDDDKLENWTKYVSDSFYTSLPSIIATRFKYRNETKSYNEQIQKNLRDSLIDSFLRDFGKIDNEGKKDPKSMVEGQKIILKIIDTLRDPKHEVDGWIGERIFHYLRLAGGLVKLGNIEEGFEALEKCIDLYIKLWNIEKDTILKYNCCALDLISITPKEIIKDSRIQDMFIYLTDTDSWEYLNPIRDTERFKKCLEKVKMYS